MISHKKEVLASQNESGRNELYWVWDKSYCSATAGDGYKYECKKKRKKLSDCPMSLCDVLWHN